MNTTTLNMTTLDGGVIIKKGTAPAPPSGGSTFEYLDITNATGLGGGVKDMLLQMAYMCKITKTTEIQHPNGESYTTLNAGVTPGYSIAILVGRFFDRAEAINSVMDAVSAMSINFSDTINIRGQVLTIGEVFAMYGLQANIDAIPRLTKEQFYSLD